MKFNDFKGVKKCLAVILTLALMLTAVPDSLSGLTVVKAADPAITTTTTTYDFTTVSTSYKPAEGGMVSNFGIYYAKYVASGITFDGTLRFRSGNVLYFPIKDDTTKVKISMICNGEQLPRHIILGEDKADLSYFVSMSTTVKNTVVEDITDYIKTVNGVKYIPIISDGDVKAKSIVIDEYNPINSVTVSGNVANATANGVTKIKFKNLDNAKAPIVEADIDASGNYSAVLRRVAGNTNYVASVTKTGFKIDNAADANKFTLTGNAATATQNFTVVTAPVAKISGTVAGVSDSMLKGAFAAELIPADSSLDKVTLNLVKNVNGSYTYSDAYLVPDMNYSVTLINADDYEVTGIVNKAEGVYSDVAISATAKALYKVTGSFVTSDKKKANVTKITFTNMAKNEYTYTFDVSSSSYTANIRAGEYETSVVCDGYTAYDHVSVVGADVSNTVYLQAPEDTSKVPYEAEVKVGTGEKFDTIASAVAYVSRMDRGENDRVTILLLDSLYREQIIVNTPNVSIKSARTAGSTITWYYGVGYSYYSAKASTDGKSGAYYDEACAVDKYYKTAISQNPGHWGATVNLFLGAKGFNSENVTFENSLTRYMTTEEVADGVTTNVLPTMIDRSKATDADVLKKANKERSAVIYIQADNTEYKNCKFLSSQDTIYTGDDNENSYFTNCVIEGSTDYICGDGNPVFDSCTLSMYSYSDQTAIGSFIVASKEKGVHGYLFNNCKIVTTSFPGLMATSGNYLARAWGPGTVVFLNTEVESAGMICDAAYTDMNAKVTAAHYSEYNTHKPDGVAVDASKRAAGVTVLTANQASAVSLTSYFDEFRPSFYFANYTAFDKAIATAGGITRTDFTDESLVAFDKAYKDATELNKNLTLAKQADVDKAKNDLTAAISALVRKVYYAENSTDIKLVDENKYIPSTAKFEATSVTTGATYEKALELAKAAVKKAGVELGQIAVYDFSLTDTSTNKAITKTLDGNISIQIPVPSGFDPSKKIVVYRVEADGTLTALETKVENGVCTFITNHFSTYIVSEVAFESISTGTQTGDTTPITLYAIILGGSVCTFMYATRKKKRIRKAL